MSEIDRIANLLRSQIEQRRTLAIGTAQSAAIQGTRALYQTPSGIISAIATNFCYGDCLLAKVEGTWYAINPNDNREVVRSSVDRFIKRKLKKSLQIFIGKFIGINDFANPRKINLDFDIDLHQLIADSQPPLNPPFNPEYFFLNLDNLIGSDESDLAAEYWQATVIKYTSNPFAFYSINQSGITSYNISFLEGGLTTDNDAKYVGSSKHFALYTQNFVESPIPFGKPTLMRMFTTSAIETGSTIGFSFALEAPLVGLGIYPNPVPTATDPLPRSILGDYYRDVSYGDIVYSNLPMGQLTGTSYQGSPVTGTIRVIYSELGVHTNSKIPLLIGHKTLTKIVSTPILSPNFFVDSKYINWDPGIPAGTLIHRKVFTGFNNSSTTINYELAGLEVDLYDYNVEPILISDYYNLISTNRIEFSQGLNEFSTQVVANQITEFIPPNTNNVLAKTYGVNPVYTAWQSAKAILVTDKISHCQFTTIALSQTIFSSNSPEIERYKIVEATYIVSSEYINPTDFRGLLLLDPSLFNPKSTILVNSEDCYAKFYKTVAIDEITDLYALEFWALDDGKIELRNIHQRRNLAGELNPRFNSQSRLYYPSSES